MISKLRGTFSIEWTWRIGIILIFVMDISAREWGVFPEFHRSRPGYGLRSFWEWSFVEGGYWVGGKVYHKGYQNWFLLLFLFGPFIVSKTIDWVLSGRDK